MFLLAHLSDPHVPPLPRPTIGQLASKRLLGYLSWRRRRQHIHRMDVLERLSADLRAQAPDHTAVTGDIANISLPDEFPQGRAWLESLGAPKDVTAVPGNHDAYVALDWNQGWTHWAPFMQGDGEPLPTSSQEAFPFLRRRGPLALIGVSTALPTPPGMASGAVGAEQCRRLESLLEQTGDEGLRRVVLLHHPLVGIGSSGRKGLKDRQAVMDVIARAGADLVLHGHNHRFADHEIPGKGAGHKVPVIGVPSASALAFQDRPAAHYHLLRFRRGDGRWFLDLQRRGLDESGEIVEKDKLSRNGIALG